MMKAMKAYYRKKRILIIVVWIVFLAVASTLLYLSACQICHENAKKGLIEQTETISGVFPSIIENDYYVQASARRMTLEKIQTLAFALQKYDSIDEAKSFLDDYVNTADIRNLGIVDRNGNLLYGSVDNMDTIYAEELISITMETSSNEAARDYGIFRKDDIPVFLTGYYFGENNDMVSWNVNGEWLLIIRDEKSDARLNIENYFDWKNVIRQIRIGDTGFILAMTGKEYKVLTGGTSSREGRSVMELGLTSEQMSEILSNPKQTFQIDLEGESYYAASLGIQDTAILALLPFQDIQTDVIRTVSIVLVLLFLVTGLCVFYVLFHANDLELEKEENRRHYLWNKILSGRLIVLGILSVIVVFVIGTCLEFLQDYADTFRYCLSKVTSIVEQYNENGKAMEELGQWFDDEYLAKCNIAKSIISYEDEEVTWQYLDDLAQNLGVYSIFVFDKTGHVAVTNSSYSGVTVEKGSRFYPLLEGAPYYIDELSFDEKFGEAMKLVGVSLHDADNRCDGFVLIAADAEAYAKIKNNLDFISLFEEAALTDGTMAAVINTAEKKMEYLARVSNGRLSENAVLDAGIDENWPDTHSDGSMYMLENGNFAAVERSGDYALLVITPQNALGSGDILIVVYTTGVTLLFLILLYLFFCKNSKNASFSAGDETDREETETGPDQERRTFRKIGIFLDRKKPFFKERWPDDTTAWKDKTPNEKFYFLVRFVMILVLAGVFVFALAAGENSFWYYCFRGYWKSGINVYSVISCLICICLLIVVKMLIHKLLFLTARASGPKGETICHLMDSCFNYILFIAGIFLCLAILGVNLKTLSLTGGVAGVIFGIGCQNVVADILAGILMTFEGVVRVGDRIVYKDKPGDVQNVGIRTTCLRWMGEDTIVRNNDLKDFVSRPDDSTLTIAASLYIDLQESLERVEEIIDKEISGIHDRLSQKIGSSVDGPVYMGVNEMDGNYVTLLFYVSCAGMHGDRMKRAIRRELKLMCERNDIQPAMPQIMVHETKE